MGVTTVSLPGGELVPSAQRGVIDAAEWINPGEDIRLGMHQVWKHYYLQGMHQASDLGTIIINGKEYKPGEYQPAPKNVTPDAPPAGEATPSERVTTPEPAPAPPAQVPPAGDDTPPSP